MRETPQAHSNMLSEVRDTARKFDSMIAISAPPTPLVLNSTIVSAPL